MRVTPVFLVLLAACTRGDAGAPRTAQALFQRQCAPCHGANGEGAGASVPPLAGSEWVTGDPRTPIRILLHGLEGPMTVRGVAYDGAKLPYGTGEPMTDAELAALVSYVRGSWGNAAAPVTAADVARERAAGRGEPWTAAALRAAAR